MKQRREQRRKGDKGLKELRRKVDYAVLKLELLRHKIRLKFYRENLKLEKRRLKRGISKAYIA